MVRNLTILLLYNLHILAPSQKSFCFFEQLMSNFRYKKQLLSKFLRDYRKRFGNLEQLVESPKYGAFFKVHAQYKRLER